jgi:hypothetical protein
MAYVLLGGNIMGVAAKRATGSIGGAIGIVGIGIIVV